MGQPTNDLTYAHQSAVLVERRARADVEQTLKRLASRLETSATALHHLACQPDGPVIERVEWARHEIATLLRHLNAVEDHLGGVGLVWSDAHAEVDEFDTLQER
jgi:hypothetical protein